jgi:hypothetical protein
METEAGAAPPARPRRGLIVALVLVAVAWVAIQFWPATNPAAPAATPSKARRTTAKATDVIEPSDLVVRLDELKAERPDAGQVERNPFRFQPKAPPPPPPGPPVAARPAPQPTEPAGPPPPPPIPLKFIGIVEPRPGDRVAAFSDCRYTFRGREGEIIDGRYRLVKIGVESVVMEYADGRGRTTIRLSGQECVGR